MRLGRAIGFIVTGLAIGGAVYWVQAGRAPETGAGAGEPPGAIEQPRDEAPPGTDAKSDDRAATVAPANQGEAGAAPADAAATVAAASPTLPAAAPAPTVSLRDPRALAMPEASRPREASPEPAPASQPRSVPVPVPVPVPTPAAAAKPDAGQGTGGPALVDRRSLAPAPTPAPARPAAGGGQARGETADPPARPPAIVFQDLRTLGPLPSTVAGPPGPAMPEAAKASQPPPPGLFQDGRALLAEAPRPAAARTETPLSRPPAASAPEAARTAAAPVPVPARPALPAAGPCEAPTVATTPLDGGRMRLILTSACRAGQDVQLAYGGAVLIRRLDVRGQLDFTLDCFLGTQAPLEVTLADGVRETVPVAANELDRVTKVAIVWRAPVNLDLHAFEYASPFGREGHIWERQPSTRVAAREVLLAGGRGRGYLSTADDGRSIGDKLEVYTFFHKDEQASGAVALKLDYETRGDRPSGVTCGTGPYAEVAYQFSMQSRQGAPLLEKGVLAPAPCGVRIGSEARFDPLLLPPLRIRK